MAEDRISSYIDLAAIKAETAEAVKIIESLEAVKDRLSKNKTELIFAVNSKEIVDAINATSNAYKTATNTQRELAKANIEAEKAAQAALKTEKEREKFKQEEIRTEQQSIKAKQEKIKVEQQEEKLTQQELRTQQLRLSESQKAISAEQREAKAVEDLANDYKQLSLAYNEAALKAKNLALQQGSGTPAAKAALAEANLLGEKLKEVDGLTGQYNRNVGNYSNAITKALGSAFGFIRQAAYILPGIGIAGILGGISDVVVSLVSALMKGKDELNTFAENYKNILEVVATANKTAGSQTADLKILYAAATDVNSSIDERKNAVKALKEEFPDYFKKLDDELIMNGKAKASYDLLRDAIISTSRAKAAKEKIDALEAQKLDVIFQNQKIENAANAEKARAQETTDRDEEGRAVVHYTKLQQEALINQRKLKAQADQDLKFQSLEQQEKFLINFVGEKAITKVVEDEQAKREKKAKHVKDEADAVAELRKELAAIQGKQNLGELAPSDADIDRVKAYDKAFEAIFKRGGTTSTPIVQQLSVELSPISIRVMEQQIKEFMNKTSKDLSLKAPVFDDEDQKRRDLIVKNTTANVQEMIKNNNESYIKDQENLRKSYTNKLITAKEYDEQAKALEERHQRDMLTLGINLNEGLIENLKARSDGSEKATTQIKNYELELSKQRASLADLDFKHQKETDDKKAKSAEQSLKKREELHKAEAKLAEDVAILGISLFENNIETQKNQLAYVQRLKEEGYARDLTAIQQSSLSEQDKAAQTIQLQAKQAADRKRYDQEQKDLDIRKAKFDKDISLLKIAENTAVGIVKALSDGNPVLAAVIGAIGAVEAATVLARPIPKYATGTTFHPGGIAEYAEAGPERVSLPSGQSFITDTPTIGYLPRGASVTPVSADELNRVAYSSMIKNTANAINERNSDKKMDELIAAVKRTNQQVAVSVSGNRQFQEWQVWVKNNTSW